MSEYESYRMSRFKKLMQENLQPIQEVSRQGLAFEGLSIKVINQQYLSILMHSHRISEIAGIDLNSDYSLLIIDINHMNNSARGAVKFRILIENSVVSAGVHIAASERGVSKKLLNAGEKLVSTPHIIDPEFEKYIWANSRGGLTFSAYNLNSLELNYIDPELSYYQERKNEQERWISLFSEYKQDNTFPYLYNKKTTLVRNSQLDSDAQIISEQEQIEILNKLFERYNQSNF